MVNPLPVVSDEPFQVGNSLAEIWQDAVDDCSAQIGTASGHLGFIYTTDLHSENMSAIIERLKAQTNVNHWVGATGIGVLRSGHEDYECSAINIMVGSFPENSFRVFSDAEGDLERFIRDHQPWFESNVQTFAVVHANPERADVSRLIPALSDALQGGYLVGALSSSRGRNVQVADGLTTSDLSGVLFSEKVSVSTGLTQGCSPIGPQRTITRSNQNIIFSIDDRPALEVFQEDIGQKLAEDLNLVAGKIFAALPVVGSDTRDYLVRNLVGIDPQHKLLAIGDNVNTGDSILFCQRDQTSAEEDLVRMLRDLKQRIADSAPRGGVYFSCLGRGRHTFGEDSKEMTLIQDELGDIPLVGFFANGEIGHRRLYSYTGVLTLFL
jgi:small ligand-binding sensory domain FIST